MARVILQVPITKTLRDQAEQVVADYGFSSLQEILRVILNKLVKRQLVVSIQEAEEIPYLSYGAKQFYKKAIAEIRTGESVTKTKNIDELLLVITPTPFLKITLLPAS